MNAVNARKLSQVFAAAQTVEWGIAGGYFKLLAAAVAVDVELIKAGRKIALLEAVPGGTYLRTDFDAVRVTSSSAQQVDVLIAPQEGGSDRLTIDNLQASLLGAETTAVVGVAAAVVLAASASRKAIYFRARTGNTSDIVLGSAGVTLNGAIRLAAGTEKVVDIAAPAAWSAISGAAAQSLDILSAA